MSSFTASNTGIVGYRLCCLRLHRDCIGPLFGTSHPSQEPCQWTQYAYAAYCQSIARDRWNNSIGHTSIRSPTRMAHCLSLFYPRVSLGCRLVSVCKHSYQEMLQPDGNDGEREMFPIKNTKLEENTRHQISAHRSHSSVCALICSTLPIYLWDFICRFGTYTVIRSYTSHEAILAYSRISQAPWTKAQFFIWSMIDRTCHAVRPCNSSILFRTLCSHC